MNITDVITIFISSFSFVVSLVVYIKSIQNNKISNSNSIINAHREIWMNYIQNEKLHRILKSNLNLQLYPITLQERKFIQIILIHAQNCFRSKKYNLYFVPNKFKEDINNFLSNQIPNEVWQKTKQFYDKDFCDIITG